MTVIAGMTVTAATQTEGAMTETVRGGQEIQTATVSEDAGMAAATDNPKTQTALATATGSAVLEKIRTVLAGLATPKTPNPPPPLHQHPPSL
jgi:hypothetical protein